MQRVVYRNVLHDGEIEVVRLAAGAGHHPAAGDIRLQPGIGIVGIVPGGDVRIVLPVPAAVHEQAGGAVRKDLAAVHPGGDVLLRILVVQIVVVIGIRSALPVVFHKVPEHGVQQRPHPLDVIAAFIAAHQTAVVVDGIEFVPLGRVIPHTGIDNDTGAVGDALVRHAHLAGGMGQEILRGQLRRLYQSQPLSARAASRPEAGADFAAVGKGGIAGPEADFALMGA